MVATPVDFDVDSDSAKHSNAGQVYRITLISCRAEETKIARNINTSIEGVLLNLSRIVYGMVESACRHLIVALQFRVFELHLQKLLSRVICLVKVYTLLIWSASLRNTVVHIPPIIQVRVPMYAYLCLFILVHVYVYSVYVCVMYVFVSNVCMCVWCILGVLLLCEVALGDMNELKRADYNASSLPTGKLSTKGLGRAYPDPEGAVEFEDSIMVSSGFYLPHIYFPHIM